MLVISMTCNQYLILVAPQSLGKLHSERVALLGCNHTGLEAHIAVVGYDTAVLAVPPLGLHHSLIGKLGQAVHSADQIPLFRLVGILGVIHQAKEIFFVGV